MEIRIAVTNEEKQAVYRSRCTASPDERHHPVVDPEDENSWLIHAVRADGEIVGSYRITRGSDGFSLPQIARYELEPFLTELPPRVLAVIERLVLSPTRDDGDLAVALLQGTQQIPGWDGILVVFGACSAQVASRHLPFPAIYHAHRTNGADHNDLVRITAFPHGTEPLIGLGEGPGLPTCVEEIARALDVRGGLGAPQNDSS